MIIDHFPFYFFFLHSTPLS